MKKLCFLALTLLASSALAQHDHCLSDELTKQHFEQRGVYPQYEESYERQLNETRNFDFSDRATITIPIVFHIIESNGVAFTQVPDATIDFMLNDINEDYSLQNADQSQARTNRGFVPANADIQFCLATVDPSGNPLTTPGVHRVQSSTQYFDPDANSNDMKATATGGTDPWDRTKYLNVWVCNITNGQGYGTAGYAYLPTTSYLPSSGIDGIVLDSDIGVREDVLTHEIGHYLGLRHTWGNQESCSSDDGFTDTPPSDGAAARSGNWSGCSNSNWQACGAGEYVQYENYMDYSDCTVMFTQEQVNHMRAILAGVRSSLGVSDACQNIQAPPVAEFTADVTTVPVGGSVNFTDLSTNGPTSWSWDFGGGATNSTAQNPSAVFNTVGTYTVTLTATNAYGSDDEEKVMYINVANVSASSFCDTVRNWDLANFNAQGNAALLLYDYSFYNNFSFGYEPGHSSYDNTGDGSQMLTNTEYAEKFYTASTSSVQRIRIPVLRAYDGSGTGSITLHVYAHDGVNDLPGAVVGSQVINIADMFEGSFNEFDFDTPVSVTGDFWVGFELNYGAQQDTVAFALTQTVAGGNTGYAVEWNDVQWASSESYQGPESIMMDVMLSGGPAPIGDITMSSATICEGGEVVVNGSNSQNTTDYFWYVIDPAQSGQASLLGDYYTAGFTHEFPTAGNYAVVLYADGACQSDIIQENITVVPNITASAVSTNSSCGLANGTVTVTASGGTGTLEYSLDGTTFQASNSFADVAEGTYTVTVRTDSSGCEATTSVTVTEDVVTTPTVTPNQALCQSNLTAVDLTATGGDSYEWSDASGVISTNATVNVSPTVTTTYGVLVTTGACSQLLTTTVNVDGDPLGNGVETNVDCNGNNNGSIDLTPSEGSGFTFSWSNGADTEDLSGLAPGDYSVIITNSAGCNSVLETYTITEPTALAASVTTTDASCGASDGTVTVVVSGGTTPYNENYNGENPAGVAGGSYVVDVTDANGCTVSENYTIATPNGPTVVGATTPEEFGNDGGVDISVSGGQAPYGYSWSNGAMTEDISGVAGGTYTVTVTDGANCTSVETFNVESTLGVEDAVYGFEIYPNPASTVVTVKTDVATTITVFSSLGQTVFSANNAGELHTVDVSKLENGIYQVVMIDADGNVSTAKIVKQ